MLWEKCQNTTRVQCASQVNNFNSEEGKQFMTKKVTKNGIVRELNLTPNEVNTAEAFAIFQPVEKFGQARIYDLFQVCQSIKQRALPGTRIYKHAVRYLESVNG
jgi:hypothetical protein